VAVVLLAQDIWGRGFLLKLHFPNVGQSHLCCDLSWGLCEWRYVLYSTSCNREWLSHTPV